MIYERERKDGDHIFSSDVPRYMNSTATVDAGFPFHLSERRGDIMSRLLTALTAGIYLAASVVGPVFAGSDDWDYWKTLNGVGLDTKTGRNDKGKMMYSIGEALKRGDYVVRMTSITKIIGEF